MPSEPTCVACGKPADPVRDATCQKGVYLHHECSTAISTQQGWNRLGVKTDE